MNSLVILKPDGVQRNLFNDLVNHFKANDLEIDEYRIIKEPHYSKIDDHYEDYVDEPWYEKLFNWMISGPIIVMSVKFTSLYDDETVVAKIREVCLEFRKQHQINFTYNTIHASDSVDNANRELKIWGLY